jgi:hypothetical protein
MANIEATLRQSNNLALMLHQTILGTIFAFFSTMIDLVQLDARATASGATSPRSRVPRSCIRRCAALWTATIRCSSTSP